MGGHYFSLSFVGLSNCLSSKDEWFASSLDVQRVKPSNRHISWNTLCIIVAKKWFSFTSGEASSLNTWQQRSKMDLLPPEVHLEISSHLLLNELLRPTVTRIQGLGGSEHHSPRIAVLESGLCDTQIEGQLGWNIHRRDEVVFNTHFTPGHSWPHTLIGLTRNFTRLMEGSVGMYRCYGWSNLPFPVEISPSSDPDFDSSLPAWKSCVLICLTWMSI